MEISEAEKEQLYKFLMTQYISYDKYPDIHVFLRRIRKEEDEREKGNGRSAD